MVLMVGMMACDKTNQLHLEKQLCDAVIIVNGDKCHAQKILLRESSAYFRALFTDRFYPLDKHLYTIPGVSSHIMKLIIEYSSVHHVVITEENVRELLIAADYLEVSDLVKECCEFLKTHLCLDNCVNIWRLAHFYSFEKLKHQSFQLVLQNFVEIVQSSNEFLDLTVEQLSEIIENDNLCVKKENLVFKAIIKWVSHALQERKAQIGVLVPKVRLGLLTPYYFIKNVKNNALVTDDPECRLLIHTVLMAMHKSIPSYSLRSDLTRTRLPSAILLAVGGWRKDPLKAMEAYDSRVDCWVQVTRSAGNPRASHGTVFLNGFVYCIGGQNRGGHLNSVSRFDPITRIWAEVSPMHSRRCSGGVCVLDGQIYTMGGLNGNKKLNTVERYDPQNDQWTMIAPMLQRRSNMRAAVLNGNIYVCGGFDGVKVLSTAEYYNPQTGQWKFIPNMSKKRAGAGVAAYGGELYAVGGVNNGIVLRSGEVYNPQSNSWRNIPDMITQRSNMGIEVMNDRMYVVGGFHRPGTTKKVEYYDNKTGKWYAVKNMRVSRSSLSCCVISSLPNMVDYIKPQNVSYIVTRCSRRKRKKC